MLRVTAVEGIKPFKKDDNISATYRGVVFSESGEEIDALIKDVSPKELVNELFSANLALKLGLKVPAPLLVFVPKGLVDVLSAPATPDGAGYVFFGSTWERTHSLGRYLEGNSPQSDAIRQVLEGWTDCGFTYAFDSWIANVDRHPWNLLFSGKNRIWMIDHGRSFSGDCWDAASLKADAEYVNRLSAWLTPHMGTDQKVEALGRIRDLSNRLDEKIVEAAVASSEIVHFIENSEVDFLKHFLHERAKEVVKKASKAAGIPTLVD